MSSIIALDYGEKRIGLAYGHLDIKVAIAMDYAENNESFLSHLSKVIVEKEASLLVVGYPISLKGTKTKKTEETENFIALLGSTFSIPIIKVDERLSTVQAQKIFSTVSIKSKKYRDKIDSSAACIILDHYFNTIKS